MRSREENPTVLIVEKTTVMRVLRSFTRKLNTHGFWIKGLGETWMAAMGPGIEPKGEIKEKQQVHLKQLAPTIANVLCVQYTPRFKVSL